MSFDRLAPFYRLMERIAAGERMQRCRTAFLDRITVPRSILTIGEGHGRFLTACLQKFPQAQITCVESSSAMIDQARKGLATSGLRTQRVCWIQSDVLDWSPSKQHDLIATHFFLDCFRAEQLASLIPRITDAAAPGADWLLADFQIAPHGWRRLRSRIILTMMYAFFRIATQLPASHLTEPGQFIENAGFSLRDRIETEWGLLRSDWWTRESR